LTVNTIGKLKFSIFSPFTLMAIGASSITFLKCEVYTITAFCNFSLDKK
jgi:hypothetical protein